MYTVLIDELVFKKDFKSVNNPDQQKIIKTIRKKLTTDPERYGEPLKWDLKRLWKLKVGQYRVIYEIQTEKIQVYVIKVGFRRDEEVYREAIKRLRLLFDYIEYPHSVKRFLSEYAMAVRP